VVLGLAEEIVLLGLDEDTGKPVSYNVSYALSAAILADLMLRGRLRIEADSVRVVDAAPTGDDVLDEALRHIQERSNGSLAHWIRKGTADHQRDRVLERLVGAKILDKVEKHALGLFPYHRYPAHDRSVEDEIRNRIRTAAMGGAATERTRLLLSLADACGLLHHLLTRPEHKTAKPIIQELTAADPIGAAVREALREDQAAILLTGAAN
jgi:golgi phosphoprotein 3